MPEDSGFLVEDFIQSITAQLDRVQDVLRLKALTRPLTYALKDFALDLNVFVDMDSDGNVRFRTSSPNETGASIVRIGFTTITKPMIDENTVSLALTNSPTLDELGLDRDERRRLEQLGVRNAAQLQQLRQSTSTTTIARYTGVPVNRLRQAMVQGQPFIREVKPESGPSVSPGVTRQPVRQTPIERLPVKRQPGTKQPGQKSPVTSQPVRTTPVIDPKTTLNPILVAPGTRRLRLNGGNLLNPAGAPKVHLAGQSLSVDVLDDDEMIIQLPAEHQGGALEIELPQGETLAYNLSFDHAIAAGQDNWPVAGEFEPTSGDNGSALDDPWSPQAGGI